jgi:hypothetical protein
MIDEAIIERLRAYIKERYVLNDKYPLPVTGNSVAAMSVSFGLVEAYSKCSRMEVQALRSFPKLAGDVEAFIKEKKPNPLRCCSSERCGKRR